MNATNVIYATSGLKPQDFKFTVLSTKDLGTNFTCVLSSHEENARPLSLYHDVSLMRLLALKSDLLTKALQSDLYGHSYEAKSFSFIINWSTTYTYMRIELSDQISDENKERLLKKLPELACFIRENVLTGDDDAN